MLRILAFVLVFAQATGNPIPATDVKSADIQATLKRVRANPNIPVAGVLQKPFKFEELLRLIA